MTFQGETVLTVDQGRELLNRLWYINVHTEMNPSGELRGQVDDSGMFCAKGALAVYVSLYLLYVFISSFHSMPCVLGVLLK